MDGRQAASPHGRPGADWPLFGLAADVRPALALAQAAGRAGALATVVSASGGGPRGLGAQMFVEETGEASGYLAGGCVEADVIGQALAAMADGRPRRLVYGAGGPVDLPLPCGGRIDVLVEPLRPDEEAALRLAASRALRRPWIWSSDGEARSCTELEPSSELAFDGLVAAAGPGRLARVHDPVLRLVLVGGEPTVLCLAEMAVRAGIEVCILRPRGPASPPPIAGVAYLNQPLASALGQLQPDAWTALVAATHDSELDVDAAAWALGSPAFHVAAIGSRTRARQVRAALDELGVDEGAVSRLCMPAGLPLGGRAPAEVAVSVLAQLIQRDVQTRAARRLQAPAGRHG